MKVYAVSAGSSTLPLKDYKFFQTKEQAQHFLAEKAKEVSGHHGVEVMSQTENSFDYLFGWEEKHISWKIVEVEVE